MKKFGKMKNSIIKVIFWNVVIFILLLSIVEITMRLRGYESYPGYKLDIVVSPGGKYFEKDSLLGYKHIAGKFDIVLWGEYKFSTHHDSASLRITSPITKTESQEKPEIWFLGGSFTHAWSVNDDETFPWLVQSKLDDYKILNWGTSGYGTIHFYIQLREALKNRDKPNIIIINHADFHFRRNSFSLERRREVSKWNFLGNLNQPYAEIDDKGTMSIKYSNIEYNPWVLSKYSALVNYIAVRIDDHLDEKINAQEGEVTKILFDKIVSLCQEHQIKIVLTNIGSNADFIQGYCSERNIPFVDISVNLEEEGATNKPYDHHPSARTNRIYANKLYNYLQGFLLVEKEKNLK